MTIHLIFRLLLLAVFAAGIGYNLCRVDEMERQETLPNTQRRYQPYNAGTSGMLPTLMLLWLAKNHHPELFADIDMTEELKSYYKRFYQVELTDENIEKIFAPSREAAGA